MLMRRVWVLASMGLIACAPTAEIDPEETTENLRSLNPPQVAFDPGNGVIPVPNTLGLVDTATFRLDLPASCGESPAEALIRTTILNTLNGWPATRPQPIDIPLTAPVDLDSVANSVLVFDLLAPDQPVPYVAFAASTDITDDDCNVIGQAPILRLVLTETLDPGTAYGVAILRGLLTQSGTPYEASVTWNLVRQTNNPLELEFSESGDSCGIDSSGNVVRFNAIRNDTPFDPASGTLPDGSCKPLGLNADGECIDPDGLCAAETASMLGTDVLWKYHNNPLLPGAPGFLPGVELGLAQTGTVISRTDILHAFLFLTQDVTPVFDPENPMGPLTEVAGAAPAALVPFSPDGNPANAPSAPELIDGTLCALQGAPPPCGVCDFDPADNGAADDTQLPCWAAAQANAFQMVSPSFLSDNGTPVPGQWSDPYFPMKTGDETLNGLYFEPNGAVVPGGTPANGWPVAVFGHGLTRSRLDVIAIVAQLNAAGIAVAAIDFPLSGDPTLGGRAIQISFDGDCAGTPDTTLNSECFAPLIGTDLAASRDYLRQGMIDNLQMIEMLKFCADEANDCSDDTFSPVDINIDPAKIGFIGQSLGGIIGASLAAVSDDIQASVLNVAATEWVGILENSQEPRIICPLIQLLAAPLDMGGLGVIDIPLADIDCDPEGTTPPDPTTWNTDPGYQAFVLIAQWILDPGDSIQLARDLADQDTAVLVQQVENDNVIPNVQTAKLAAELLGLSEATAASTNPAMPTMGITDTALVFVNYADVPGTIGYCHGSLFSPADEDCDPNRPPNVPKPGGAIGTAIMQNDAITFLNLNLNAQ